MVGVGASAGGLEAFGQLLSELPADTGMAFVFVQHLDPHHESLLANILAPLTAMPVLTVKDGITIEADKVYVIPPNTSVVLEDDHLKLSERGSGLHLPIDTFFSSLARVQGGRAVGVVLSGTASDGSVGVRAIKAECGLTFAQEESTARFGGMPRNAAATGAVDYVLSPAGIGRELGLLKDHPYLIPARPGEAGSETLPHGDGDLKRVFTLLFAATTVDFSHYKPTTLRRRISRRMMVLRINSLGEYAQYAEQHAAEVKELYGDLLISVTSFFRDPESFRALCELFTKALSGDCGRKDAIRVWVPGCATGEEVYSLAICLNTLAGDLGLSLPFQFFGTDIDEVALERARQGKYSEIISEDVTPERLKRFFNKIDSGYQIVKQIRESCVFARHDLTRDPPFSRIDLISCRNLLIYLDAGAQKRVLPIFHFALRPDGLLMLGSAETTSASSDLFAGVDKQHNIYGRKPGPGRIASDFPLGPPALEIGRNPARPGSSAGTELQRRLDRVLQSKYSPNGVLVDAELQIVKFFGHTRPYLDPTPGEATLNLLRMVRESLVVPLRRILKATAESRSSVKESGILLEWDGGKDEIALEITPVTGESSSENYWLVVFTPGYKPQGETKAVEFNGSRDAGSDEGQIPQLERELSDTREYLRNLTEEYEAHSEELHAANEEARSANEELQSTNEELGTTKEELQSANEELTTVNEELQHRNEELGAINNDLRNLLSAVSVAILMVDSDQRVRRFNPVAEKLLELAPIDIGRPIGHLRGRLSVAILEKQIEQVMETLHTAETEVQDNAGHWYSILTRPYRTLDDRIAGAVVTIQDINPLKRGLKAAEEARDYAEEMIETVREPLIVLDADLRVVRATVAFFDTFLVSREETEGRFLYDLGNGQWNRPRLRELIGSSIFRDQPFQDYELEHEFPHIGWRTMRLNARRIPRQDLRRTLLLAIEDVTERREVAQIQFQRLFETAKDGIVVVEAETGFVLDANPYFLELSGCGREEIIGRLLANIQPFSDSPEINGLVPALKSREQVRYDDVPLHRPDGCRVSVEIIANSYQVGSQPVVQLNLRDISVRKEQDESLKRSLEEKALLVREVHHRVKNNLQVIVSLLSLQSNYTDDPAALKAFEEAEGRVRAIAAIHETLYARSDLAEIEFAAYLTNLVNDLLRLHARTPDGVVLELETSEMALPMEQAIPLGLIANELIINSLKHGLSKGGGTLKVELKYRPDLEKPGSGEPLDSGSAELSVADDGPGLPADIDIAQAHSMGFRLLHLLSKQLRGSVKMAGGKGARVTVEFPLSAEEWQPEQNHK